MKAGKKIAALLLALVLVVGLCACSSTNFGNLGGNNNQSGDSIVGTWETEIDMTAAIEAGMGGVIDVSGIKTKIMVPMTMTFEKNGKASLELDMKAAQKSVSRYLDEIVDPLVEAMYDQGKQSGMTEKEFDAAFEEQYGMSVRAYCEKMIGELDLDDMLSDGDTSVDGYWKLDGKKLYFDEDKDALEDLDELEYLKVKISGDTLTLDEGNGDSFSDLEAVGISLPLEFKRA